MLDSADRLPAPRIQIVIPCYNEASRLDVAAFSNFLSSNADTGLICVNDGSRDETLAVLAGLRSNFPRQVHVVDQQPNQGKAEAVRIGMQTAIANGAQYAGYFDADLATPLEDSREFVEVLDEDPNIEFVVGARVALLGRRINRKPIRHYLGRVFATAASMVLALPIYDTQCGAKLLRVTKETGRLFEKRFGSRWIFDVELLARYITTVGNRDRIYELPLRRWTDVGDSRVKSSDFMRAGAEMAAIYRTYGIRRDFDTVLRLMSGSFLRYVAAGGVGTTLHYLSLTLLVQFFGQKPEVATAFGALVGAATNYVLNFHFTFASRASHRDTLPKFLLVAASSAIMNAVGLRFATEQLGMHYLIAQLGCTAAVLVVGYLLNRVWTFKPVT